MADDIGYECLSCKLETVSAEDLPAVKILQSALKKHMTTTQEWNPIQEARRNPEKKPKAKKG